MFYAAYCLDHLIMLKYIFTLDKKSLCKIFFQHQKVKEVMSNRYSVDMFRLDLRNFHNDIRKYFF